MSRTHRPVRPAAAAALAALTFAALTLAGCATPRYAPSRTGAPRSDVELSPRAAPGGGVRQVRPSASAPAQANAESLRTLPVNLFNRAETGWEVYMPLLAAEIGAAPVPQGVDFARALARWQRARGLADAGIVDLATLAALRNEVQNRRPFLRLRSSGVPCPDPPDETTLAFTTEAESWGARPNPARPGTLAAWRRMRAAAARDGALDSPLSLQVFSGYRSPVHDAGRCAVEGVCDGVRRATCSAHRTGLALDLVLDGLRPVDSTAPADRLRLSRTASYRWLLANAGRFGFVNYPFEPWHWEWTGEAVDSPRPAQATDLLPPGLAGPPG